MIRSTNALAGTFLLIFLLGHGAEASAAGIGAKNSEIGFSFGWSELDETGGGEDLTRFGIRGGYHFTDLFQLEGQVFGLDLGGDHHATSLSVFLMNAVFNFHPRDGIVPYVLVGFGEAEIQLDAHGHGGEPVVLASSGAFQLAMGSRFFVGRKLAFRVEGSILAEETFGAENEHLSFSAGLTWRIGKDRSRPGQASTSSGD